MSDDNDAAVLPSLTDQVDDILDEFYADEEERDDLEFYELYRDDDDGLEDVGNDIDPTYLDDDGCEISVDFIGLRARGDDDDDDSASSTTDSTLDTPIVDVSHSMNRPSRGGKTVHYSVDVNKSTYVDRQEEIEIRTSDTSTSHLDF